MCVCIAMAVPSDAWDKLLTPGALQVCWDGLTGMWPHSKRYPSAWAFHMQGHGQRPVVYETGAGRTSLKPPVHLDGLQVIGLCLKKEGAFPLTSVSTTVKVEAVVFSHRALCGIRKAATIHDLLVSTNSANITSELTAS